MKKNTKKGFTLVELLVVIAILAILASVSVVGYTAFINKAEKSNADTETTLIKDMVSDLTFNGGQVQIQLGTKYYLLSNNSGTITVEEKTSSTENATDITTDIGTKLIAKLSFSATAGLQYKYDSDADAVTLYAVKAA